jgi:hypothetical protein
MCRLLLLAALPALALAGCSKSGGDAGSVTLPKDFKLVSASQDFPDGADEEYPAGPHADALNNNCRACHSPSMVTVQPPLTHDEWVKEVGKMMNTLKAPVPEEEVPKIRDYLDAQSARESAELAKAPEGIS